MAISERVKTFESDSASEIEQQVNKWLEQEEGQIEVLQRNYFQEEKPEGYRYLIFYAYKLVGMRQF